MQPFFYQDAPDVAVAVAVVAEDPGAQFVAGGTSQVDLLKEGVQRPTRLVDISRLLPAGIEPTPSGGLRIGANVKNSVAARDPSVRTVYPAISEALLAGASQQIRNMASMAGNLLQRTRCPYLRDPDQPCNKRDPGTGCAAVGGYNRMHAIFGGSDHGSTHPHTCIATHPSDLAVALAAHEAVIVVEGPAGTRHIAFEDLHRLPGETPQVDTNLQRGDLIVAIELPAFRGNSHYLKVRDRASYAYALVSCAVALQMDGERIAAARIALGGVAHKPWRVRAAEEMLTGQQPTRELFRSAAAQALQGARTYRMNGYKPTLARVLVERALLETARLEPSPRPGRHGVRIERRRPWRHPANLTHHCSFSRPMDKPLLNLGTAFTSIGQDLPRADGRRKVTGAATYTAEWQIPGLTYGAVVDSAIARGGTVRAIDASAALAAPGVLAVVTHENAPRLHALPSHGAGQQITGEGGLGEERQPLQDGTIYYGAQSVAVVVADYPGASPLRRRHSSGLPTTRNHRNSTGIRHAVRNPRRCSPARTSCSRAPTTPGRRLRKRPCAWRGSTTLPSTTITRWKCSRASPNGTSAMARNF